jgi:hypothetical protein
MGDMQAFIIGLVVVLGFVIFATQGYVLAAQEGGFTTTTSDPFLNKSQQYFNQTQNMSNELAYSIQQSQTADPSINPASEWQVAGSAVAKTLLFVFTSLGIMVGLVLSAFASLSIFGLPGWISSLVIMVLTLVLGFAIVGAILRYNP